MKLKRGSYSYLIGFLILTAESIFAIVALFFAYFNYNSDFNPLLSEYGSRMSGGLVAIVLFSLFTVWTMICPRSPAKWRCGEWSRLCLLS